MEDLQHYFSITKLLYEREFNESLQNVRQKGTFAYMMRLLEKIISLKNKLWAKHHYAKT